MTDNKMADLQNGVDAMENGDIDYDAWHPPSETELKIIEAKRERQDKISKLMGEYLLKGYKMLSSTCPLCMTILLRTKQGVDYCVACNELDSDSTKDDPALSDIAAQRQAQESYLKQVTVTAAGEPCVEDKPTGASSGVSTSSATASSTIQDKTTASTSESGAMEKQPYIGFHQPLKQGFFPVRGLEERLEDATTAVVEKLEWATGLLRQTQDLDASVRLCNLIKCCAETINSLRSTNCCDM